MREANDRGFDCVVVEDACAATEPSLHASTLDSIKMEGGIFGAVTSSEDVMQALDTFKSVTVKKLAPQIAAQMAT
jgi:nicotinamidase-related amidase